MEGLIWRQGGALIGGFDIIGGFDDMETRRRTDNYRWMTYRLYYEYTKPIENLRCTGKVWRCDSYNFNTRFSLQSVTYSDKNSYHHFHCFHSGNSILNF